MARLHANGLTVLHVDHVTYRTGSDGMLEVPPEHAEAALSHGATRDAPAAAAPLPADRLTVLEARVAALEAAAAPAGKRAAKDQGAA